MVARSRPERIPSRVGGQRVDVATTADGLTSGGFISSDDLPADATTIDWTRAEGEAEHHWRVLTRVPDGWASSSEAMFPGPGCVGADPPP
jgi:hypothetical protein